MSIGQAQFKKILGTIDQKRLRNQQLHYDRKAKLYAAYPRLQQLDETIAEKSSSITRRILERPGSREALMKELHDTIHDLSQEKATLLEAAGYPSDYLKPIYDCYDCHDTGFIEGDRCHCLKKELIRFSYNQSNLSHVLAEENFDTFSLNYYSEAPIDSGKKSPREMASRNYKACYSFATNFSASYNNLILHGQAGLGKTFLCNAIAKEVLDQGYTVIYMTAFNLFRTIENYRFHNDEGQLQPEDIAAIYECDLLIIDDLGTEVTNAFTNSELFSLINSRLLEQKPIVISTNLNPSSWTNVYSDRIVSRIYGNYLSLGFVGQDIRLKKRLES